MDQSGRDSLSDPLRRRLLGGTAALAGLSWLNLNGPLLAGTARAAAAAHAAGRDFEHLDAATAADLEAMAARIIPSDDTPGAREAGVIHFMDQAFGGFMAGAAGFVAGGLAEFNITATMGTPHNRFAELPESRQDAALHVAEDGQFFGMIQFLTVAGMFAMPSHGGNRDHLGWKLIGFEHRHAWQPPFGHYDAPVHAGNDADG